MAMMDNQERARGCVLFVSARPVIVQLTRTHRNTEIPAQIEDE